jgi:hypothetical protein
MAANPKTTRPEFSPAVQERRAKRAAQAERTRSTALDALDVGKGWSGPQATSDVLDGGTELALRQSRAATEAGPLRGSEQRKLRREFREQPIGRRQPSTFEWLEQKTPLERDEWVAGEQFASFPEHVQAFVLKERARLEEAEEEAEYRLALQREEDSLEAIEAGEEFDWETEVEPTNDDR